MFVFPFESSKVVVVLDMGGFRPTEAISMRSLKIAREHCRQAVENKAHVLRGNRGRLSRLELIIHTSSTTAAAAAAEATV